MEIRYRLQFLSFICSTKKLMVIYLTLCQLHKLWHLDNNMVIINIILKVVTGSVLDTFGRILAIINSRMDTTWKQL